MSKGKINPRRGGSFAQFLKEEGLLKQVKVQAGKELLAWKLHRAMGRESR